MDIFKNKCIHIKDEYYVNINRIINTFNSNDTTIFLFTKESITEELKNIIGENQIYNDISYLDNIHYISIFKKNINKIIIFIDFESKMINHLEELNITYIYCSKNNIDYNRLILVIPNNISISDAKRYAVILNTNKSAKDYYEYINNIEYMIFYDKLENWKEYIFEGNNSFSEYKYLSFDELCDNKNYIIKEKLKIKNIINLDDCYEKKINDLLNSNIVKNKILKPINNDNDNIIYYENIDKLNQLYHLILENK
jgi:hypothetical protein